MDRVMIFFVRGILLTLIVLQALMIPIIAVMLINGFVLWYLEAWTTFGEFGVIVGIIMTGIICLTVMIYSVDKLITKLTEI